MAKEWKERMKKYLWVHFFMLSFALVEAFAPPVVTKAKMTASPNKSSMLSRMSVIIGSPWLAAFFLMKPVNAVQDEYTQLLAEARRLEGVFKEARQAEGEESVEKVTCALFEALQKEDEKEHGGLKALLARSSPFNFMKSKPFDDIVQIMNESKYKILLGHFDSFRVLPLLTTLPGYDETAILDVDVVAKSAAMDRCGVPMSARRLVLSSNEDEKVTFRIEFHNPMGKRWLFDTLYYVFPDMAVARV